MAWQTRFWHGAAALGLGLLSFGCVDLAPHRRGAIGRGPGPKTPPTPAPALAIPNAPAVPIVPVAGQRGSAEEEPPAATRPSTDPIRMLYERAARRWAGIDSYVVRLRRREVIGTKKGAEELMLVKFRKQPWSVYFKWLGPTAKGREVTFSKGRYGNQIHTLTARGDIPFVGAGMRINTDPDSAMVKARSRRSITEAGFGNTIAQFGRLVADHERGNTTRGTLKYQGSVRRAEFTRPLEAVVQTIAPGADPLLPGGGQRQWYFDTELHLPMLILALDDSGREVEYYCHDRFEYPVRLDDDDFDPDRLWKK